MKRYLLALLTLLFIAGCSTLPEADKTGQVQKPIVVLVGIDGLRADYIDHYDAPALQQMARDGVRAEYMTPVMPSVTFVNFYTLATGLYAEHTGITANMTYSRKWDEVMDRTMHGQGRWWGGEPIWVTAEKQHEKSAAMFWLGSEAEIKGVRPSIWNKYEHHKPNGERVDQVLSWLALPEKDRPRFITIYFADVDTAGHRYGPDSVEVGNAVKEVDNRVADIRAGIKKLGLEKKVDVIVVSDHGMTATSADRMVYLDDYINLDDAFIPRFDTKAGASVGPFVHMFVKDGDPDKIDKLYKQLKGKNPHMQVYKFKDIPKNWHLNNYDRVGDLFVVAENGWLLWGHSLKSHYPKPPSGMHGYDRFEPDMRASFFAAGPNIKRLHKIKPFENVEVYGIVAKILGLKPAKTDGDIHRVEYMLKP